MTVIYDPAYSEYAFGGEHPFSPTRVEMVIDLLREASLPFDPVSPQEPAGDQDLLKVHQAEYIEAVAAACAGKVSPSFGLDTPDNPILPSLDTGARSLVGGTLFGARLMASNQAKRVLQMGGGLHHAQPALASGFCIYNDLAIAIRELVDRGLNVVYLDIDVHHGDGVQSIFYDEEKVLCISIHESGEYLFPGTGWTHELGRSMGRGFKLNIPLEPFTEDDSYLEVMRRLLPQSLAYFRPDVMVFQAGADAHFADPLADLNLTSRGFESVYRFVLEMADRYCGGRVLTTLGGGYSLCSTPRMWTLLYLVMMDLPIPEELPMVWRQRWAAQLSPNHLETLHDPPSPFDPIPRKPEIERHNRLMVERLEDAVSMIWL